MLRKPCARPDLSIPAWAENRRTKKRPVAQQRAVVVHREKNAYGLGWQSNPVPPGLPTICDEKPVLQPSVGSL